MTPLRTSVIIGVRGRVGSAPLGMLVLVRQDRG
jgi:hypothetical protein